MATKKRNQLKQIVICSISLLFIQLTQAQDMGYFTNRVKIGDICYQDSGGVEHFIDYRDWDLENPPGTVLGVVFYTYYGPLTYDPSSPKAWHGWIVEVDQSEPMIWAPTTSVCYSNCVALYEMEGINTPWNPHDNQKLYACLDTCGWQNTYRFLDFVYTLHGRVLSDAISPVFYHVFSQKNGVTDFSVKPTMDHRTWYLPAFGQLRAMYSAVGYLNAALNACGGTLFYQEDWYSSTELGSTVPTGAWALTYAGVSSSSAGWFKNKTRCVRAVRNF